MISVETHPRDAYTHLADLALLRIRFEGTDKFVVYGMLHIDLPLSLDLEPFKPCLPDYPHNSPDPSCKRFQGQPSWRPPRH